MDMWEDSSGLPASTEAADRSSSVARRRRQVFAAVAGVAGLVAMAAGWVGVSGTRVISDQLSYLASGAVVGASLVGIAIGVLVIDYLVQLEQGIAALHARLTADPRPNDRTVAAPAHARADTEAPAGVDATREFAPIGDNSRLIALEGAHRVHRPGCQLVRGKETAFEVTPADAREQELGACRICKPALSDEPALASVD